MSRNGDARPTFLTSSDTGVSVAKAYGRYSMRDNIQEINSGCDVLCATTGRAKDFIGKKRVRHDFRKGTSVEREL